eukprot:CAMPEP_0177610290 /NCGR_PEP_ID=MMETSP0419_2-20121207/19679_1 /TAXON_ID=582737 /ORGANISM="Tetraselmis sp., Strain GSL018" /LENGTH=189 /DNA_ID=CAMNT_0019105543 /DNA_START=171 /DNA_END=741 /DNA_ORIENTATION=-
MGLYFHKHVSLASALSLFTAGFLCLGCAAPAVAIEKIGEFTASGLVFKDSVELLAMDDPEVLGVTVYISDFRRSLADKLAKDFFSEPSQASIYCSQTAPDIVIPNPDAVKGSEGKEVFSQQKNLNFFQNKTLRVRRVFDEARETMIYIAYSTRLTRDSSDSHSLSSTQYKTSICAVPLHPTSAANTAKE